MRKRKAWIVAPKNPHECRLYSWRSERRATRSHIRNAIHYALVEKRRIATQSDAWYERASFISRQWRDQARARSVKQLARWYLEYWRSRAFMTGAYGLPGDWEANLRWRAHAQ